MYITKEKKGLAQIFNLQTEQQVFMALDIVSRSALHVNRFPMFVTTHTMTELI